MSNRKIESRRDDQHMTYSIVSHETCGILYRHIDVAQHLIHR